VLVAHLQEIGLAEVRDRAPGMKNHPHDRSHAVIEPGPGETQRLACLVAAMECCGFDDFASQVI
jgi:hypothetical protein